jgi:hypothetical protein
MERETDKNDLLHRQTFLFMCLYTKSRTTPKDYKKGSVVQLDRPPAFSAFDSSQIKTTGANAEQKAHI